VGEGQDEAACVATAVLASAWVISEQKRAGPGLVNVRRDMMEGFDVLAELVPTPEAVVHRERELSFVEGDARFPHVRVRGVLEPMQEPKRLAGG